MAGNDGFAGKSVAKYVGYKISRVRWKPRPSGAIRPSDIFVAGSWDDKVNRVAVWQYDPSAAPSPPSSPSPFSSAAQEGFVEPVCECEVGVAGDVMDLQFVDEERMAVGLSTGSVTLLHFRPAQKTITQSRQWERVHYITTQLQPRPVTAVATSGLTIATGGEDGRINILHPEHSTPLRTIENADNATVTGLVCTMKTELLATSSSGQLKLWDLRAPSVQSPSRILVISGDSHPLQCLDRCPNQPHLVAVGRANGSVCLWDLRQDKQPVSILDAHSSDIWEIQFHRHHPNHLFTCSQDSTLWHWDASPSPPPPTLSSSSLLSSLPTPTPSSRTHHHHHRHQQHIASETDPAHSSTPWLSPAVLQGKVDITNLLQANKLPVNSFDVESRHVVCGTDSEMLFLVPNLTFR